MTLRPQSPWFTPELTREKQERRKLEAKYKKSQLAVDRELYNEQRNVYNSKLTEAKQTYFKTKINEAKDSKDKFDICNNLLNRGKKTVLPTHECTKELADRFVSFFSEKKKISKVRSALEAKMM